MKLVLPGGSRQVGTLLARAVCAEGHDVVVLSRGASVDATGGRWRRVPWNAVDPGPWTAMRALRQARGVRIGLPATRWMLEAGALLMRTETELVLKSRRVVPARLLGSGFEFRHPTWPEAARELCSRAR